ncbi:hypothetical protein BC629DRAFT_1438515 [Irpex lacteus]|nr:hypothetical protein BC629DRAFT_1438515 [Irpex lacteus]
MDKQSKDAIRRLCEKPELREKAQHIFRSLKVKTGHGSGFELNQRTIALPAISSLLASEELGYNDVTEKIAQAASCLNPKEFKAALTTVHKALASAEREKNQSQVTYQSLVMRNANKDFMIECMQDVEAALTLSGDLRGRLRPPNDIVTVSVYAWTCKILGLNRDGHVKQNGVSEDDYQEVVDALDANCQIIKREITAKVKSLRAERRATRASESASPTKSALPTKSASPAKSTFPTKAVPLAKSPSKSSLRDLSLSPTKTPTHKRKVAFSPLKTSQTQNDLDSDSDVENTPSKRRKFLSPSKHSVEAFKDALRGGPSPSTSKTPLELLQERNEDEEMEEDEDTPSTVPPRSETVSENGTDVEMSDALPSVAPSSSENEDENDLPGPVTPRRSHRQPKPRAPFDLLPTPTGTPSRTPSRSSVSSASVRSSSQSPAKTSKAMSRPSREEDEQVVRRRRRPVLLEHVQWYRGGGGRYEREWKAREEWVRGVIEVRGHPFESLRA